MTAKKPSRKPSKPSPPKEAPTSLISPLRVEEDTPGFEVINPPSANDPLAALFDPDKFGGLTPGFGPRVVMERLQQIISTGQDKNALGAIALYLKHGENVLKYNGLISEVTAVKEGQSLTVTERATMLRLKHKDRPDGTHDRTGRVSLPQSVPDHLLPPLNPTPEVRREEERVAPTPDPAPVPAPREPEPVRLHHSSSPLRGTAPAGHDSSSGQPAPPQ